MKKSNQGGFTLIELVFVMLIIGIMMILELQQKSLEFDQMRARQLGVEVFRYSTAVQEWVARNSGRIDELVDNGELGTKNGVDWLKGTSCTSGVADHDYLPCEFLESTNGKTTFGALDITTEVIDMGNGVLQAVTVFDEMVIDGRRAGSLMGLAALVASGAWNIGQNDPSLLTTDANIRYCVTEDAWPECAGREGNIVVVSTNNSQNDRWLRVDHGNNMQNAIEFDAGVTDTDTWGYGFSLRQIKNVARIYNEGSGPDRNGDGIADDALYLGKDGHSLPATLLSAGVVVDADQAVLGKLTALGDIEAIGGDLIATTGRNADGTHGGGNISGDGDLTMGGSASIDDDLDIGGDVTIEGDLDVEGNSTFDGWLKSNATDGLINVTGIRDIDNTSYYINPNGKSKIDRVEVRQIEGGGSRRSLTLDSSTLNFRSSNASETNLDGRVRIDNLEVRVGAHFVPLMSMLPEFVHVGEKESFNGDFVRKPSCSPGGGTPQIVLTPHILELNSHAPESGSDVTTDPAVGVWEMYAEETSGGWNITAKSAWNPDNVGTNDRVLARTYCVY